MKSIKLANFLKSKRQSAGYSQVEISKQLGYINAQFVSNWERGLCVPPTKTIKKLVKLYKLSIDEVYEILLEEIISLETEKIKKAFGRMAR